MIPLEYQHLTADQLKKTMQTDPDVIVALIFYLIDENTKLKQRVKELEDRLNQNSNNSSKPPSTDGYQKPNPKSLRGKSGKTSGGQPGHKANWLEMNDHPDHIVTHAVLFCEKCHYDLSEVPILSEDKRQVFDIIVRMETTEHCTQMKVCPHAHCRHRNQSTYPEGVDHKTQYGPQTKGLFSYLHIQQLLPLNRISEMIHALTDHSVSEGTIIRANQELHAKLEPEEQKIKAHLLESAVLHSDESGVRVNKKRLWLHTACTPLFTYYTVHKNRGKKAMDEAGLLPVYKGTNMHDGWKAYNGYTCKQALCNEHHHRELNAVIENDKQPWAQHMIDLLYAIKKRKEELVQTGCDTMGSEERAAFEDRYRILVKQGFAENPPLPALPEKKPGPVKQSKTQNLLNRLDSKRDAVLAFMHDFRVPFTNNVAEQAIRMIKNQQKVSGSFRSMEGAQIFSRVRGFVSTLRKQNLPILNRLRQVFEGKPVIPESITSN